MKLSLQSIGHVRIPWVAKGMPLVSSSRKGEVDCDKIILVFALPHGFSNLCACTKAVGLLLFFFFPLFC